MNFQEIMQRIREVILWRTKKSKIKDKDIAEALNLDPQYYAVIKRRKKIPYLAISLFCKKHKVNMNWILLKEEPISLAIIS